MHETQATNVTSDKDVLASCLASLRSLRSLSSAFTVRKVARLSTRNVSKRLIAISSACPNVIVSIWSSLLSLLGSQEALMTDSVSLLESSWELPGLRMCKN